MADYGNNYDYGDSPFYKDEDAPVVANNYYVDLSKPSVGNGSEEDPFNYPQFINYFNTSDGNNCGVTPGNGDILNLKGIANLIGRDNFLHINRDIVGTITVKPWDWVRNGIWLVETKDNDTSVMKVISNQDSKIVETLELEGFAFLLNNSENERVEITSVEYVGEDMFDSAVIVYRNHHIYCRNNDIYERPVDSVFARHRGFTFNTDNFFMNSSFDGYNSYYRDGVIKANNIIPTPESFE